MSKANKSRVIKIGKPPKMRVVGFKDEKGKRKKPNEFTAADAVYFRELHKIVDEVFAEADSRYQLTWDQLADEAGLAYQTVANLGDRKTKWPQFRTVWRLCKAVGWDLVPKRQPKKRRAPVLKIA